MAIWEVAKDLILSTAAITGAYVAVSALGAWKEQLKGKTDYDLSRRILITIFKCRDAIEVLRHPIMSGNEMPMPSEEEARKMDFDQNGIMEPRRPTRCAGVKCKNIELPDMPI